MVSGIRDIKTGGLDGGHVLVVPTMPVDVVARASPFFALRYGYNN
jgi:hypothetical protein